MMKKNIISQIIMGNVPQICEVACTPIGVDKWLFNYIIIERVFVKGNLGEAERNRIICC